MQTGLKRRNDMKKRWLYLVGLLGILAALVTLTGCKMNPPGKTIPNTEYRKGLTITYDQSGRNDVAVQQVVDLFGDFSKENLEANLRDTYSEELYFRDGFKEFTDFQAFYDYMVHSTEALRECSFAFPQVTYSNGDYYLRWEMTVALNRDPEGERQQCVGMSHIRFNEAGKVVFQQDYWDPTDVLYNRIPVANWLIKKVHQRL